MTRFAEGTKAYLAGMIDGEGYIGIARANPKGHEKSLRHALTLVVTNNDLNLMNWLLQFGGHLRRHGPGNGWQWIITRQQAGAILRMVRPYLIVKAEQADLALAFLETFPISRPKGGAAHVIPERERFLRAIKAANGRLRHVA